MASGVLFTGDKYQSFKSDGTINAGGSLTFYSPGTTNLKSVYSDQALTTPITNPVTLDSAGRASVFIDGTNYDVYVKDSTGTLIYSQLNVYTPPTATASMAEWTGNTQDTATSYTGTKVSTTSFTVSTNLTNDFHVGRRLKITDGGSTLYGYISASSYSNPNTTITVNLDSGSITNNTITVYLSILRADNSSIPSIVVYTLFSSTSGATVGPSLILNRGSPSPTANDILGELNFYGKSTTGVTRSYGRVYSFLDTPTNTLEYGRIRIAAIGNGAESLEAEFKGNFGMILGSPAGSFKGSGTINAAGTIYQNNVPVATTSGNNTLSGNNTISGTNTFSGSNSFTFTGGAISLGTSGAGINSNGNNSGFTIAGGNGTNDTLNGGRVLFYGSAHATNPGQLQFYSTATLSATMYSDGGWTLASPTGASKGVGTINAASGIYDNGNRVYSKTSVVSPAAQTPVANTTLTFAHGLGVVPSIRTAVLVAGSAPEAGYTTGDEADFLINDGGGSDYPGVVSDATNVLVIVGSTIRIISKTTRGPVAATLNDATKWQVKIRAWL